MGSMGMSMSMGMGMGMGMGSGGLGEALGTFLQVGKPKRVDRDLHQGMKGSGGLGIEALAWRGSLVTWADSRYVHTWGFGVCLWFCEI